MTDKYKISQNFIWMNFVGLVILEMLVVGSIKAIQSNPESVIPSWVANWSPLIAAGITVIALIWLFFSWRCKSFCIENNDIVYSTGIILRKQVRLSCANLGNIIIERPLINIIWGVSLLKINSGEVTTSGSEVTLLLPKRYAAVLKSYFDRIIRSKTTIITEPFPIPNATLDIDEKPSINSGFEFMSLLAMTLTGNAAIISGLVPAIITILAVLFEEDINSGELFFQPGLQNLPVALVISAIFLVLFLIGRFVFFYVKYHGFLITREGNYLSVEYGLLNKIQFTVPMRKINGIIIKQTLTQRIFGLASINISAAGLTQTTDNNNESTVTPIIFPIIKLAAMPEFLKAYLPEFITDTQPKGVFRKKALHFFVIPLITAAIICAPFIIAIAIVGANNSLWIALALFGGVLLIICLLGWLMSITQKLGFDNTIVIITRGYLSKSTYLLRKKTIQRVVCSSGPFKRMTGVTNVSIINRAILSIVVLHNFENSYIDSLQKSIMQVN